MPVKANEPWSVTTTARIASRASDDRRRSRKSAAAVIGPIVCDDDGPMPSLKTSKTLRNIVSLSKAPA